MPDQSSDDYIRLLQAQMEELEAQNAASSRAMMLQLERVMIDKFRLLREERGWSQKEMAERMRGYGFDFHQSTVAKLESGGRPLRVAEMYALSHIFRLPPGAVFFMAYSTQEYNSFDELTRLLAAEEESRAHMHEMLTSQVEQAIDILADHQTRMNELVSTMRRVAASDPSLEKERARLAEKYPEEDPKAKADVEVDLMKTIAEVKNVIGLRSDDGVDQAAP